MESVNNADQIILSNKFESQLKWNSFSISTVKSLFKDNQCFLAFNNFNFGFLFYSSGRRSSAAATGLLRQSSTAAATTPTTTAATPAVRRSVDF